MEATERRIVALGGGGFSMEPHNPLLDEFVLTLVPKKTPRICFLPTASADSAVYIVSSTERFWPQTAWSRVAWADPLWHNRLVARAAAIYNTVEGTDDHRAASQCASGTALPCLHYPHGRWAGPAVPHSEFLSHSASGRTVIVHHDDERFSIVDLLLVNEVEVSGPVSAPTRGNGNP